MRRLDFSLSGFGVLNQFQEKWLDIGLQLPSLIHLQINPRLEGLGLTPRMLERWVRVVTCEGVGRRKEDIQFGVNQEWLL
jgi:hypothetical protein